MEGTSCGENCCFVKSGFCESEKDCPNYCESIWEEGNTGKVKVVKDCSPKRIMLEQQKQVNTHTAVIKSMNVLRDKVENLESLLMQIINESKIFFAEIEQGKIKPIEYKEENENTYS